MTKGEEAGEDRTLVASVSMAQELKQIKEGIANTGENTFVGWSRQIRKTP